MCVRAIVLASALVYSASIVALPRPCQAISLVHAVAGRAILLALISLRSTAALAGGADRVDDHQEDDHDEDHDRVIQLRITVRVSGSGAPGGAPPS